MRKFFFAAVLVTICGLNAAGQFAAMRSGFDNQIVNSHAPKASDATDYVERAVLLSHGHLAAALGDAHRSPGYPLFLTIFQPFAQPQFDARIVQLALTALLPLLFALILHAFGFGPIIQIGGALMAAIYPFFYFFTPTLYAEALSLVAATLLILALTHLKPANVVKIATLAGILLTVLIYLKPNILPSPPRSQFLLWWRCPRDATPSSA